MVKQPVITKDFYNNNLVICNQCKGNGTHNEQTCTLCNGTGLLHRVVEGIVKLYTTI